uniref:Brevinin-1SPb n=1 Tax=Lithobates septentrionalis TaxID=190274 RepID=BR1B_LITST|nr:RecName: Full=Brevinin-1SPb [Lithobates septentrionalis]
FLPIIAGMAAKVICAITKKC